MGRTAFCIYVLLEVTLGLSDSCMLDISLCARYGGGGVEYHGGVHVRLLGRNDTLVAGVFCWYHSLVHIMTVNCELSWWPSDLSWPFDQLIVGGAVGRSVGLLDTDLSTFLNEMNTVLFYTSVRRGGAHLPRHLSIYL